MVKIKGILTVGVILLFLGLAVSPITAQTAIKDQLDVSTIGDISPLQKNPPLCRSVLAGQQIEESCLASPVWANYGF